MKDFYKEFLNNNSGVAFIAVAITIPIILFIIVMAIDLSNSQSAYLDNQSATESATASTADFINDTRLKGKDLNHSEIENYAYELVKNNMKTTNSTVTLSRADFSVTETDESLIIRSCTIVKNSFAAAVYMQKQQKVCSNVTSNLIKSELPLTIQMIDAKLNRQTGLIEVRSRVVNPNPKPSGPIEIAVDMATLPGGTVIWNRQQNASPQILYIPGLSGVESKDFIVELYLPLRIIPTNVGLKVQKSTKTNLRSLATIGQQILPTAVVKNSSAGFGGTVAEFPTIPGKSYVAQYSSDNRTWTTSVPVLPPLGTSQLVIQYFDNGPPRTNTHPRNEATRYYRFFQEGE